jgi:hypothetical protein
VKNRTDFAPNLVDDRLDFMVTYVLATDQPWPTS